MGATTVQQRLKSARSRARMVATTRARSRVDEGEDGFIAIDALVALTLISTTLALVMLAGHTAIRISEKAGEVETARTTLIAAIERTPAREGVVSSAAPGGRLTVAVTPAAPPSKGICLIHASLAPIGSHRTYAFEAARPCIASLAAGSSPQQARA